MLPSSPLLRVLLATAAPTLGETLPPRCEVGVRHLTLTAAASEEHTVCIRPEVSTNLYFDVALDGVKLAARERFQVLDGETGLALLPLGEFADGERIPLTVYFRDGEAPVSASFVLVVHPAQAERQLVVSRQARTLASFQQGERQAQAEARECQEDKTRLAARCGGRGGFIGLLEEGRLDEQGIQGKKLITGLISRPEDMLEVTNAVSYRGKGMLAVDLELTNRGTTPWHVTEAAVVGPRGTSLKVLRMFLREPIPPEESRRVTVELEATPEQARGRFTLKLWGEAGLAGGAAFGGVTFP